MLFHFDSPFGKLVTRLCDLIVLNVVYVPCCIPVFTIGAATSALYYVVMRMCRDEEGNVLKNFFHAFRGHFGQSAALTGIWLGTGSFVLLILYAFNHVDFGIWNNAKYILYFALLIHFVLFTYVFPVFARFDNTVKNTVRNSWHLAMRYPVNTAVVCIINGLPLILAFFLPQVFSYIFFLWFFLLFALQAYWNAGLFRRIFAQFEPQKESEDFANAESSD